MTLGELLNVVDENIDLYVSLVENECVDHYDGKNGIDEMYNNQEVLYITQNGFGGIVIEINGH